MPRYQYRCPSCQREEEVIHSMSEEPEIMCLEIACSPSIMKRVITSDSANFVLKGSGYYRNDSRIIRSPSDVHGTGLDEKTDPRGVVH